jgi:hypothetical protein
MNFTYCDSCGKTFTVKEKTWNPNFKYFTNHDFCYDCYKKLEEAWEDAFHKCGHDMQIFKEKKVEIANAVCSKTTAKASSSSSVTTTTTSKKKK